MDEQSQNESEPKIRRAKNGGAEETQPSRWTRAGSNDQAEQETPENVSEKPSQASETSEEVSDVSAGTDEDQAESVLPWPLQATQHALEEWTHFFGRATERNFDATEDLSECPSITGLVHRQVGSDTEQF